MIKKFSLPDFLLDIHNKKYKVFNFMFFGRSLIMATAKVVTYCNERYQGSLDSDTCDILEQLIEIDQSNGCIPDLRHIIYNIDDSDVTDFIESMDMFGMTFNELPKKYGELRDEQTVGVAFMYYAGSCILGDSVGMGKTVETAGLCNLLTTEYSKKGRDFRYLVLTGKNLATQFREELVKFTGRYVQLLPSGLEKDVNKFIRLNPYQDKLSYSVVGTHALLTTSGFIMWLEQCRTMGDGFPFDMIVIDESSVLGGSTTQIAKGFKAISKYAKRIVFLNATPFETSLNIFYNQLSMIDSKMLPTKQNFTKEYCIMDYRGMYPKPTGKYKNQGNFKKLIGYRYFARTRRDKGAVMEDCSGRVVLSSLSQVQKEWLVKSQLHNMVFDCPNHIDPTIEFNSQNVPKLGSLNELLCNECAEADTIIIFVQWKEAQHSLSGWLSNKGYSNRILNGDTKSADRQSIIRGFKNKEFRILITNVQKGLNFGDCNYCIFYSFDPNPSSMIQFEGRITRDFDIVGKNIFILCSLGIEYKKLNEVVRQRAKATTDFTNTDYSVIIDILLRGSGNGINEE